MIDATEDRLRLSRYCPWLRAAAAYNALWGGLVVLFPGAVFALIGAPAPSYRPLWQVVGMLVMLYAPAYWWASRDPVRHRHLVLIGLAGKVLGPAGFAWSLATGQLPAGFALVILTNDLLWWPAFGLFVRDAARVGGWPALLRGE
jgi:hypothetical protein